MIVQVSRTVRIVADDGRNFTLQTLHHNDTKDVDTWRNEAYYPSLETACQALLRHKLPLLADGDGKVSHRLRIRTREVIDAIKDAEQSILSAIEKARRP